MLGIWAATTRISTMDTSLSPKELDVQRMLACEVHIGTRN
eukprot:COSAG01_NODE_600_length_14996_cov_385.219434_1_plen_39_part_10